MITKPIHIDISVYSKEKEQIPNSILRNAKTKADLLYEQAGIDLNNFKLEQKVIIRNTLIKL